MNRSIAALLMFAVTGLSAQAAEIKILSAGAVEPGLEAFVHDAEKQSGHSIKVLFNTAPQVAKRLAAGESYDILISPPAVIDQAVKDGKAVGGSRVAIGRVGGGILVRRDAPTPNVGTVDGLKQALLAADSVVYNTASTGLYLDKLFGKLGILDQLKPKTTRYANGAAVMEHVIKGKGNEIGFGAITEIKMYEPKGARLVGPLPADVQNYTSYEAVLMTGAAQADAATAILKQLAAPQSKKIFTDKGIE